MVIPFSAFAQEVSSSMQPSAEPVRTVLTVEPLMFAFGQVVGGYERAVSERWSLVAGAHLTASAVSQQLPAGATETSFDVQSLIAGVEPGLNYFVIGRAPEGLWVGPRAELYVSRQQSSWFSEDATGIFLGGGLKAGYTARVLEHLVLEASVGISGRFSAFSTSQPDSSFGLVDPKLGYFGPVPSRGFAIGLDPSLAVGWAF
jgi:hypothetical protein